MAKPEWGTKRLCADCGVRFYDLNRKPIVCPKCETVFVIEVPKPSTRSKAKPSAPVKPVVAKPEPEEAKEDTDDEAALLKKVGIEEDDSDDGEEDGVVGDVFVEEDDEDEDVSNVIDTPAKTNTGD